jgi:hypothetical protein
MLMARLIYDLNNKVVREGASFAQQYLLNKASTDLFLALALAMAFFSPCSAILTQSYGKSI